MQISEYIYVAHLSWLNQSIWIVQIKAVIPRIELYFSVLLKFQRAHSDFFLITTSHFYDPVELMRLYQRRMQGKLIFRALFFIREQIYRNLEGFHPFVQTALATSRLQTPQGQDFYLPAPGAVWDTCKWYSIVCGWAAQARLWYVCVFACVQCTLSDLINDKDPTLINQIKPFWWFNISFWFCIKMERVVFHEIFMQR